MDAQAIIDLEQQYILQTYRRPPFVLERGDGVTLYDTEGKAYLDLVGGIAVNALGYGDPEVLSAIAEQSQKLIHISNLYHTIPHALLAQALVGRSFADRVFFCNTGTEAVEGALKFARKWAFEGRRRQEEGFGQDKYHIVAFTGSFHGRTVGALSITSKKKYREPFEPLMPGVRFAAFNDLAAAEDAIDDQVCAVIVEPVQGEGGVNLAETGFLQGLRALCDERRALLIFDEVQCGLGRTGTLWAHEHYGVTPDIMTLAKPLAGGLPIGAVLMTEDVAQVMKPGDHGSTFAANPVICAVAQVVFNRIAQDEFLASVRAKGEHIRDRLKQLKKESSLVSEVRGRGLMWGIDLTVEVNQVQQLGYEKGLLLGSAGPQTLRLLPPLTMTRDQIDVAMDKLSGILRELTDAG